MRLSRALAQYRSPEKEYSVPLLRGADLIELPDRVRTAPSACSSRERAGRWGRCDLALGSLLEVTAHHNGAVGGRYGDRISLMNGRYCRAVLRPEFHLSSESDQRQKADHCAVDPDDQARSVGQAH